MTTQQGGASLNPELMSEGTGLPSGDMVVQDSRFVIWDYGGRGPQAFALRWTLEDNSGQTYQQHYSAGDPTRWQPGEEGKFAVAMGAQTELAKNSNVGFLMTEVVNAGFPADRITGDASVFKGLYALFEPKQQPTRAGLPAAAGADGTVRPRMSIVPTVIHNLPWENSARPASTPGGAPTPPPAASPSGSVDDSAMELVVNMSSEKPSGFSMQDLAAGVFSTLASHPNRDQIAARVFSPDFRAVLTARGFQVSGDGVITPAS